MTTNQTIDGVLVSRELLELALLELEDRWSWAGELRALLDADKVNNRQMGLMQFVGAHPIKPAAQPQGEPVAMSRDQFEAWVLVREHPTYGWLDKHWLTRGDNPETYADPYVQGLWVASQTLYAEQPAPVAVVLPERKDGNGPTLSNHRSYNQGWNAYDTELKRLNPSL